jgi:hypothetical protein
MPDGFCAASNVRRRQGTYLLAAVFPALLLMAHCVSWVCVLDSIFAECYAAVLAVTAAAAAASGCWLLAAGCWLLAAASCLRRGQIPSSSPGFDMADFLVALVHMAHIRYYLVKVS